MTKICAGLAISKEMIDVHAAGVDRRFKNDRAGFRAIDGFLRKHAVRRVAVEATGRLAKTDKTDARMLAAFAAAFADLPATEPKSAFLDGLNDLMVARAQAVEIIKTMRQRRDEIRKASAKKPMDKIIKAAERQREALEAEIEKHIKSDPDQARAYRILMSVPGIGPVTAAALLGQCRNSGSSTAGRPRLSPDASARGGPSIWRL